MANNLGRQINAGDNVVVSTEFLKDKTTPVDKRIFICDGSGFGTSPATMGKAVFGKWKDTNKSDRIEGYMIDAEETNKLNVEKD